MDGIRELRGSEQRVQAETLATFGEQATILERALGLALRLVEGHELALDHTLLRAVLVSRSVASLRVAWLSALAGHRTQSLTLARAALEDYATASWVAEQPEDAELWLWEIVEDAPKPGCRPPRVRAMLERVSERNTGLRGMFKGAYGNLSEAAHPRAPGLQWNLQWRVDADGERSRANLLPFSDASGTAACLHFLLHFAALILGTAAELRHLYVPVAKHDDDALLLESLVVRVQIIQAAKQISVLVPFEDD